jgi:peptidoglycan-associated lipoprotein
VKISAPFLVLAITSAALLGAGCARKKVAATTPPPPPAAVPAATAPRSPATARVARPAREAPATAAGSRYPDAATRARIDGLLARIQDAYFDYDRHALRADALKALAADAVALRDILADYPDYKLTIEGHCDERGSAEYNLALGDARAKAARDYLVEVGIPTGQFRMVSYGKDRPSCSEHDEPCWQKNRRIHIIAMAQ